jgi:hypothetical protein
MPEELYVPERMRIAQPARVGHDVSPYCFPVLCVELSWPSAMLLSPQCGQPTSLELIYPSLDCASVHSEPIPDSITIEPMADEQNGMQAVVVAGFCRPCDLGFQGELGRSHFRDSKLPHCVVSSCMLSKDRGKVIAIYAAKLWHFFLLTLLLLLRSICYRVGFIWGASRCRE